MNNRWASASCLLASLLSLALFSIPGAAQQPDPALLAKINAIRAIDNHSHTPALTAPGEKDDDYDALPCEPLEPTEPTLTGLPDNAAFLEASKSLFGYPFNDRSPAHVKELLAAKARVRRQQGDHYPDWVLDRLGIETELSNRIAMGRGLNPPRFRWVPFDAPLLFPLDNSALASGMPAPSPSNAKRPIFARSISSPRLKNAPPRCMPAGSTLVRLPAPTIPRS